MRSWCTAGLLALIIMGVALLFGGAYLAERQATQAVIVEQVAHGPQFRRGFGGRNFRRGVPFRRGFRRGFRGDFRFQRGFRGGFGIQRGFADPYGYGGAFIDPYGPGYGFYGPSFGFSF